MYASCLSERQSFPGKFLGFPARIYAYSERSTFGANPGQKSGLTCQLPRSGFLVWKFVKILCRIVQNPVVVDIMFPHRGMVDIMKPHQRQSTPTAAEHVTQRPERTTTHYNSARRTERPKTYHSTKRA